MHRVVTHTRPHGTGFVGSTPPMEADHPPPESAPPVAVAGLEPPGVDTGIVPSVVAVVVARGEAVHLEACLGALAASDYPDLTVLVMAPPGSDLKPRVA